MGMGSGMMGGYDEYREDDEDEVDENGKRRVPVAERKLEEDAASMRKAGGKTLRRALIFFDRAVKKRGNTAPAGSLDKQGMYHLCKLLLHRKADPLLQSAMTFGMTFIGADASLHPNLAHDIVARILSSLVFFFNSFFRLVDADNSGHISRDEFTVVVGNLLAMKDRAQSKKDSAERSQLHAVGLLLKMADANSDGTVTTVEAVDMLIHITEVRRGR